MSFASISEVIEYPVAPLKEIHDEQRDKNLTAGEAVAQLVQSLSEFGVNPLDIEYHLLNQAKNIGNK